jgi:sigma-B regulation protein RsbU (phosphoserine phosphatase)
MPLEEELVRRVKELEAEVKDRETDLARFREQLLKANHRLEKLIDVMNGELKLAQALQRALVPVDFPHISGFEFSNKFIPSAVSGGDYFDIFEHEDKFRFGIMVSSSSGHTMSALLLGVMLKMTSQLEARKGSDPHLVMASMFDQIKEHLSAEDKADMFYALIDRRSYEMRFVRAGQMVVLYQSFSSGEIQVLDSGLGPFAEGIQIPTSSKTISLNPRDRIAICTRGVIEARNLAGEPYGMERVSRSLLSGPKRGVHEMRNHLLYEVQKFSQGQELQRDQTVLVIEVKDKVIKLAKP